ncbi:alpha/beta hydrolase [Streptomyces sp. Ncost-T10-10d]|uniref:alpha/beta hydrolase n=1 Tax=Streptomyces sp. Ncost-T10-10d TaxID=1839774 RepID=UPI00081DF661|nr:alpha/beta hydrolase [Streptomyces sp. Ncost-T10-10d]SCF83238.1 acetyl esterase [Streptomyces sp. Ncost-T10-10d]
MASSQRRLIARRTRYCTMVALLATTGATLSACAGRSDRAADNGEAVAAVSKQMQATYVPCGKPPVKLEKIDQDFLDQLAAADGTPLYKLSYKAARDVLNKLQAGPVDMLPAQISKRTVPGGPTGPVSIHVVRPNGVKGNLPAIVYIHGGGWVLGNFTTHERLVRQIADGARAAVVFVDYTPSPEAQFPVPVEQAYAVARWVAGHGREIGVDASRLAVAGDSVGGDMTAAVTLMSKQRGGPHFRQQVMLYPVADANFNTPSYNRFAENCWLTKPAMKWFWDAYAPRVTDRSNPLASPLHATVDQLRGLPPALMITDSDVLLDAANAYAAKLRAAGVPVTSSHHGEVTHDFMMLNALADTEAAKQAVTQTTMVLREALHAPADPGPGK